MYRSVIGKSKRVLERIKSVMPAGILVTIISITVILLLYCLARVSLPSESGHHDGNQFSYSHLDYVCKASIKNLSKTVSSAVLSPTVGNVGNVMPNTAEALPPIIPSPNRAVRTQLLSELWSGDDPFQYASPNDADNRYPYTNLQAEQVKIILAIKPNAIFWLEIGSMLGGSLIRTAYIAREMKCDELSVISIDPFVGDVHSWASEKALRAKKDEFRHLNLQRGAPTIYPRFLANIRKANYHDMILPIVATSIIGMRLLERLIAEKRLNARPDVIYLDAAHEKDETFLELRHAWNLLLPGGILFGDDWAWESVSGDVLRFTELPCVTSRVDNAKLDAFKNLLHGRIINDKVVLLSNANWIIPKKEGAQTILC